MLKEILGTLPSLVTILVAIGGGIFSVIRWYDIRRRELRQQRWTDYSRLIAIVSGLSADGRSTRIPEQVAALYQLLEFPEYASITVRALDGAERFADQNWRQHVAQHRDKVVAALSNA
jgi:hypothetical protein